MSRAITAVLLICCILVLIGGCAKLPDNSERSFSYAYTEPDNTTISKNTEEHFDANPGESGFLLLKDGMDAFVARAVLANAAEHTIDAQYYLLHQDTIGGLFIDQLLKAADRGVRVRLLLDDIGLEGRDFNLEIINEHPNVEIRVFNPFGRNTGRTFQFLTGFGKQTRRSHNKSFSIDNVATILGGRNIGDEYFLADPQFAFLDLDVFIIGPVVKEVSYSFDKYWNHELSFPISLLIKQKPTAEESRRAMERFTLFIQGQEESAYVKRLNTTDLAKALKENAVNNIWATGHVVADDPEKLVTDTSDTTYHLLEQLWPYFTSIRSDLLIYSPYFVPGKEGVAFFKELRSRGVRVRILTNSLASTDVPVVHSGYANYRRALLRMGVELYELKRDLGKDIQKGAFYESKSSLHAKAFVLDKEKVFIGSLNFDPRSVVQNTEIGIVIDSAEIANQLIDPFDNHIAEVAFRLELKKDQDNFEYIVWHGLVDGKQQTFFAEPFTSLWQRFMVRFLRLIPAESQL